jgi:LPS export ABC transporter protein LptC
VKGSIVVILLSVAVLIGVLFLSRGSSTVATRAAGDDVPAQPGYSARDAQVIETDEQGQPVYRVEAAVIRQRPDDNRVQLTAPRMSVVTSEGDTVHVQARSGQIREDGSEIQLFGDVKLEGELSGTPVEVATSILYYDTPTQTVRVPAPVTFRQSRGVMDASGLTADLKQSLVTLESVNGQFEPKK